MCTLTCIDKLIDAGIDSFKIEGRLKSPQYVSGVTSIYRKYIDMYLENEILEIDQKDLDTLSGLYIRSELSEGYYFRHNSQDMITKLNPSYNESDERINKAITDKFVKPVEKKKIMGVVTLVPGENASIILKCGNTVITAEGDMVQPAQNRPLNEEEVLRQLNKTGESYFEFDRLEAQMDGNCFMPIKALNELRRQAFDKLKEALIHGS